MSFVWNKLDTGLSLIYANYLRVREHGVDEKLPVHPIVESGGRLNISLRYSGDLAEIEALGFDIVHDQGGGRASGAVNLDDIERLAAHPGVVKLSYGLAPKPFLDRSIPNIGANHVWQLQGPAFAGTTGTGVIVGIIDTGIDFTHPFFSTTTDPVPVPPNKPVHQTRILRIWDQTLDKKGDDEHLPDPLVIDFPQSWGVEYTAAMINDALKKPESIILRHTDTEGHGTHVASIAAGNGRDKHAFVGIAPEADLVIVKLFGLVGTPTGLNPRPSLEDCFEQAVNYILNVAAAEQKSVVINYSAGDTMGPHDGFTSQETFLSGTFENTTGRAFVIAAGNDSDWGHHASILLPNVPQPASGAVTIPLELYDTREVGESKPLRVELYYPADDVSISVKVSLPPQGNQPATIIPETPFPDVNTDFFNGGRAYTAINGQVDSGAVRRKRFMLTLEPLSTAGHARGTYSLTVKYTVAGAAAGKIAHLWCEYDGMSLGLKIGAIDPQFTNVSAKDRFLISSPAGADNTICVAAYDARNGTPFDIDRDSSAGPLADYGSGFPQPAKPDLAAPGSGIKAAASRDYHPGPLDLPIDYRDGAAKVRLSGTSMAAPHVAGTIALMLKKKKDLGVSDIARILKTWADPYTPAQPERAGAGRLNAEDAFDSVI